MRCRDCDIVLFSNESKKAGLCSECRDPDLHDALESATDLEEKMDILFAHQDKKE